MYKGFYVVRSLSHTDRQQTWKVLSRCWSTERPDLIEKGWTQEELRERMKESASQWMEFMASEETIKGHDFAVVEVIETKAGPK